MALTQQEKELVLIAAELIDREIVTCSCDAVRWASPGALSEKGLSRSTANNADLERKYQEFFGMYGTTEWPGLPIYSSDVRSCHRHQRVMMLLTFAEIG